MGKLVDQFHLAGVHESIEDFDYSRFEWGYKVTSDVITAAAVVLLRENPRKPSAEDVVKVMARGWVTYDSYEHLRSQDEDGDLLNTLMSQFSFPAEERSSADDRIGRALVIKARESGEDTVTFEDDDVPSGFQLDSIVIFQKEG